MTNQEAIKWLNEAEILDLTSGNTKDRQAIDVAVEALENQIPKKVRREHHPKYGRATFCPNCSRMDVECWFYCPDCGQAIDWRDL